MKRWSTWDNYLEEQEQLKFGPDGFLDWIINNPYTGMKNISDLYMHSQAFGNGHSPWLLFQYVIGMAHTSQGMGLNSLMDISPESARFLGFALISWSREEEIAEMYCELILMYGGE